MTVTDSVMTQVFLYYMHVKVPIHSKQIRRVVVLVVVLVLGIGFPVVAGSDRELAAQEYGVKYYILSCAVRSMPIQCAIVPSLLCAIRPISNTIPYLQLVD